MTARAVLTLDLGQHSAYAFQAPGMATPVYGSIDLDPNSKKPKLRLTRVQKAAAFLGWLSALIHRLEETHGHEVYLIVYERPFARGMAATRLLWGMAGIVEALAERHGSAVDDITPSEIKQHAAGSGKATKDDMLLFATTTGYPGEDEHEADAWCLLRYVQQTYDWEQTDAQ